MQLNLAQRFGSDSTNSPFFRLVPRIDCAVQSKYWGVKIEGVPQHQHYYMSTKGGKPGYTQLTNHQHCTVVEAFHSRIKGSASVSVFEAIRRFLQSSIYWLGYAIGKAQVTSEHVPRTYSTTKAR